VLALAQGAESPLQRPSLGERMAGHNLSFALVSAGTAGAYPAERAEGHRAALDAALADSGMPAELRHLAPWVGSGV